MTASSVAHGVGRRPGAKEERKVIHTRKPLIEKENDAREINSCLDQLKDTVIGAFRLDQSKLEKADILEMTVKHLQNIQSIELNEPTLGLEVQQKYSTGYIQCVHQVHNMLLTCDWMDKNLGSRLLNHLLKSLPRATDERPLRASAGRDAPHPGTPLGGGPLAGRQPQREGPTCNVAAGQERPALRGCRLGRLEMWRPW
uniref:hairy-related 8.2 n=1 Tax=Gasterosteus aculeatus aculeatus TaxID=481459 RepID=UPI001A97D659|nr:hairy-related 8.2 [Gasterosteus aculeatus aculeatus]